MMDIQKSYAYHTPSIMLPQIRKYREHTKQSAIDVLNLHRFTKNPAHQRADGLNPTKAVRKPTGEKMLSKSRDVAYEIITTKHSVC